MSKVAPYLQVGIAPVIITNKMAWGDAQLQTDRTALLHEIDLWHRDWASLNTTAYLKHDAINFSSEGVNYDKWAKQKQSINPGKSRIKVNLSNVSLFSYPDQPGMVVVNFDQDYKSSNRSNHMKIRQYWVKSNSRWQIIYEGIR